MKARYYVFTALYCAAIFWVSSQSEPVPTDYRFEGLDKLAHVVVYAGLAALVSSGIRRSGRPTRPAVQALVPLAFAVLYGISDEIHQYFIPERSFDPLDIVANTVGALAAQVALCRWWRVPLTGTSRLP
ncbi:MAG TPA: VanZ family protein [Candidatus Hydrogenedentes bacterium]|nr:VanZ family protein [Candidatus Hydrogenedentota bacterium]